MKPDALISGNFSGGPGALPAQVVQEAREALSGFPGCPEGILGLNHRAPLFRNLLDEAEERLRRILKLDDDWLICFMQGGGITMFDLILLNFLQSWQHAIYVEGGYWSAKATSEAIEYGEGSIVRVPVSPHSGFLSDPCFGNWPTAAFGHAVTNETVEGLQLDAPQPATPFPWILDLSSDLLSREIDLSGTAMFYAHAQKNLGPAGATLVGIRKGFLDRAARPHVPTSLSFKAHMDGRSLLHTPPVFAIYVILLGLRWLENEVGGLLAMESINREKAAMLYATIDGSRGFYAPILQPQQARSIVNVCWELRDTALETSFLKEAGEHGLIGLGAHRAFRGMRASLYNGTSPDSVALLVAFMKDFAARHDLRR